MSKLFLTLMFSLLFLFSTTSLANEELPPEAHDGLKMPEVINDLEEKTPEHIEEPKVEETQEEVEIKEEISDDEKEARAAEAAELQEIGVGEEPIIE